MQPMEEEVYHTLITSNARGKVKILLQHCIPKIVVDPLFQNITKELNNENLTQELIRNGLLHNLSFTGKGTRKKRESFAAPNIITTELSELLQWKGTLDKLNSCLDYICRKSTAVKKGAFEIKNYYDSNIDCFERDFFWRERDKQFIINNKLINKLGSTSAKEMFKQSKEVVLKREEEFKISDPKTIVGTYF